MTTDIALCIAVTVIFSMFMLCCVIGIHIQEKTKRIIHKSEMEKPPISLVDVLTGTQKSWNDPYPENSSNINN